MSDKRVARKSSALLSPSGYLRLSSDLVPPDAKDRDLSFVVTPMSMERRLRLRIVENGEVSKFATRKAMYANARSRCPIVTVKTAMKFLGISLPKKSIEFPVRKVGSVLTIQF